MTQAEPFSALAGVLVSIPKAVMIYIWCYSTHNLPGKWLQNSELGFYFILCFCIQVWKTIHCVPVLVCNFSD